MPNWQHVTGKSPKNVCIVACGPTTQEWLSGNMPYDRAYGRPDEVWLVNKGARTLRGDLVFVMDELVGEGLKSQQYAEDLRALKVPIITSIVDSQTRQMYPDNDLHTYPIGEVYAFHGTRILRNMGYALEWIQANKHEVAHAAVTYCGYLHNSIPYMLAYAAFIGVKKVGLFGADETFPGQMAREDDRANCEYWVGMLRGQGIQVVVPPTTTLLNTRSNLPLYGYGTRQPVVDMPTDEQIAAAYGG